MVLGRWALLNYIRKLKSCLQISRDKWARKASKYVPSSAFPLSSKWKRCMTILSIVTYYWKMLILLETEGITRSIFTTLWFQVRLNRKEWRNSCFFCSRSETEISESLMNVKIWNGQGSSPIGRQRYILLVQVMSQILGGYPVRSVWLKLNWPQNWVLIMNALSCFL